MNIKIEKTPLKQGQVRIISSKSDGHRSLIAAALAEEESVLFVDGWSEDMEATARCLQSLGAEIEREPSGIYVMPIGVSAPLSGGQDWTGKWTGRWTALYPRLRRKRFHPSFSAPDCGRIGKALPLRRQGETPRTPDWRFAG